MGWVQELSPIKREFFFTSLRHNHVFGFEERADSWPEPGVIDDLGVAHRYLTLESWNRDLASRWLKLLKSVGEFGQEMFHRNIIKPCELNFAVVGMKLLK